VLEEIDQQLLSGKHFLTLRQVMHLAPDLKQYVVSRISLSNQPTHHQAPPSNVILVTINPHMAVIPVHVGKNIVEDVLFDGELGVNIITQDLRKN
jgi:hypothetical protein